MPVLVLIILLAQQTAPVPQSCRDYRAAQDKCRLGPVCDPLVTDRLRKQCQKDGGQIIIPPSQHG